MSDAVPTAAPDDRTYRVAWELIEQLPDQVTVRAHRISIEPDPGDSDGIPQAVEVEVSARRGTSDAITDQVGAGHITPAIRVNVLTALAELAYRDGHADMMDYPILVEPVPGRREVRLYVRLFKAFTRWFAELAQFDFADIERHMARVAGSGTWFAQRRAGVQVLRELAAMLPTLRQFDDTPHLLLRL